jgi:hypothetical protein
MQAYRTRPADPDQIALVAVGARFPRRLLSTLHANRALLLLLTQPGLIFSLLLAVAGLSAESLLWVAIVTEAIFVGPALLALAVRSLAPSPNEVLLPSLLLLREGAIEVTPRDGPSFETRWTWIAEARETQASFVLLLCREPHVEMVVSKSILLGEQRALLGRWLREHKVLRG